MKSAVFLLCPLLVGLVGIQGDNNSESVRGRKYAVQYSQAIANFNSCDEFHVDGSWKSSNLGTGTWSELDLLLFSAWSVQPEQTGGLVVGFSILGVVISGVFFSPYDPPLYFLTGAQVSACPPSIKPRI